MSAIGGLSKAILAGPIGGLESCNLKYDHTNTVTHMVGLTDKDRGLLTTNYKVIRLFNLQCSLDSPPPRFQDDMAVFLVHPSFISILEQFAELRARERER